MSQYTTTIMDMKGLSLTLYFCPQTRVHEFCQLQTEMLLHVKMFLPLKSSTEIKASDARGLRAVLISVENTTSGLGNDLIPPVQEDDNNSGDPGLLVTDGNLLMLLSLLLLFPVFHKVTRSYILGHQENTAHGMLRLVFPY